MLVKIIKSTSAKEVGTMTDLTKNQILSIPDDFAKELVDKKIADYYIKGVDK